MKRIIGLFICLLPLMATAQQSEFQKTSTGQDMLAKTDALIKQLQDQGYTLLNRIDTICECKENYNCVNFLNRYLTDEVSAMFCLSSNEHGVKLNGVASERSKRFVSYRWNEEPFKEGFEPYVASCLSWEGILDEVTPTWYSFSYYQYGRTEHLITLYFSKPNKAKLAAWQQKNGRSARPLFMPLPLTPEKQNEEKAKASEHKKGLQELKPEARKAFVVLDSISNRFKQQDIWGNFITDTLLQPHQTFVINESYTKDYENIFSMVSSTPLTGLELRGTPFESWSPSTTEIIKDINSSSKGYFIRNVHMIGSIKKITIENKTEQPTRIWLQTFSNMYNPYYWRCKEFLMELAYVKREAEKQKAEKAKAAQEALAAERAKKVKAQGIVCSYCGGTGVEYEYSKCMLCGGDGETTEFVTGKKTVGQKKIHKSTSVSGNETYEVRDTDIVTVDGKKTVTCKLCNGNGSTKTGKKHTCPVCDGKGKVY